jgi:hypothetical protein
MFLREASLRALSLIQNNNELVLSSEGLKNEKSEAKKCETPLCVKIIQFKLFLTKSFSARFSKFRFTYLSRF